MAVIKFFKERLVLILSVLFPVYMFFLHAPFEMFLTNRENFWFNLKDFWEYIVIAFAIAFFVLLLIGMFLPKKLRDIYSVIGIAGGICVYVQGNFLNIDLGVINGMEIIWSEYTAKFIINLVIWAVIIIGAVVAYFIFKGKAVKILSLICSFVFLIQVVTLGTLFINYEAKEPELESQFEYAVTDKDLYTVSKDQNVIFMLLDMFDNEFMRQLLAENPEMEDTFKDFTFFDNAVGAYSTTCYSIGNFLTGTTVNNQGSNFNDSIEVSYAKTKMFEELIENDYLLDIYIADGYIPQKLRESSANYEATQVEVFDNRALAKKLYQLVGCRFAPDYLKRYIWMNGTEFADLKTLKDSEYNAYSDDNLNFYNGLVQNGIKVCDEKRFKFIHLIGTHHPYKINSDLQPITPTSSSDQVIDTAKGVMKIVSTFIEELKRNEAYENSTIVLVADHGYYEPGVLTNPLVMIKQANVNTPFTVSDAPVSHYDLHATIMSSIGLNANNEYGRSMFDIKPGEERERLFYQYNLTEFSVDAKFRLIEWSVGSSSNERKNFKLTGYEYDEHGVKQNHTESCAYCLKYGTAPVNAPNSKCIPHYKK